MRPVVKSVNYKNQVFLFLRMAFKIVQEHGHARTGLLATRHGKIKTPFFMPVATKGALKHIAFHELKKLKTRAVISNAFLLSIKPGLDTIKKAGGLHRFVNWDGVMFTDSGGFQMLSDDFLLGVTEEGILFRNPFSKSKMKITPERVAQIQQALKSDVAMILDDVPKHTDSPQRVKESFEHTNAWTLRFLKAHTDKKQMVFGIAQGGHDHNLRKKSAEFLNEIAVDGIAIGGLCIGESLAQMHATLAVLMKYLRNDRPRYLMGVGSPVDILKSIGMGVDIFDSCFPTRNARHGEAYTCTGKIAIKRIIYSDDLGPLDKKCVCDTCSRHSKAYLHHLYKTKEVLAERLLSVHNVFFIQDIVAQARHAIAEKNYPRFAAQFIKAYEANKKSI